MRTTRVTRATSARRLQVTVVVLLCVAAPVVAGSLLAWIVAVALPH